MYLIIVAIFLQKVEVIVGDLTRFCASGIIVSKIIMILNNNHFDFLPNFLQLCALYCETAFYILI